MDTELIHIDKLLFDSDNPRLPVSLHGTLQSDIFQYLSSNAVIDELILSMLDNGFFPMEPLIVLKSQSADTYSVLEGNRRLASLFAIHRKDVANGFALPADPTPEQIDLLTNIPCLVVESRESISRYLGFRHIGGIKPWKSGAKSRFVVIEVDSAVRSGSQDPFYEVGRKFGSNSMGIRNSFLASRILLLSIQEGIDANYVLHTRFGVWLRCMNSRDIREYIAVGSPRTYEEVVLSLKNIDFAHLREVVADLTPSDERSRPLLSDSRDITRYGSVLLEKRSRTVLRRTNSLSIAYSVIQHSRIPDRIREITTSVETLQSEISERFEELQTDLPEQTITEADRLFNAVRVFKSSVQALKAEE